MVPKVLYILGQYLVDSGLVEKNPASNPGYSFHTEVFQFGYEENAGYFEFFPTNYYADWYLWVERAFNPSHPLDAVEAVNMLVQCLASVNGTSSAVIYDDESGITFEKVLDDWVPVDEEDTRGN